METPVKIFVVEDHEILRFGLNTYLSQQADFTVCGDAGDARQALDEIKKSKPDVVLVDLSLGKDLEGLNLIRELKRQDPDLPAVVLSMHDETLFAERALQAGAKGYVMKEEPKSRIVAAIRAVLKGKLWLSHQMRDRLLTRLTDKNYDPATSPVEQLTNRELEVFHLLGHGYSTLQIAGKLYLGVKTVETYRQRIKEKLGLADATALLVCAVHWVAGESHVTES